MPETPMSKLADLLMSVHARADRISDVVVLVLMPIVALAGVLLGLCSLVLGGYQLWQGSFEWKLLLFMPGGLLWLLVGMGMLRECRSKYFPQWLTAAELAEPARQACALTWDTLEQRLEEMAAIEPEEVELDKEGLHIAWWDRGCRSVVIQGMGGADWLAFCWGGREKYLSDKQLQELCLREGAELPSSCLGYRPAAIAFCRSGSLTVYPASSLPDFVQDIPLFRGEDGFRLWMEEARRFGVLDV